MSCREIDDAALGAWIDGELPPDEDARVTEHAAACRDCAARADALRDLRASVRDALPPLRAPDLLRRRVEAAVRAASPPSTAAPAPVTSRPMPRRWLSLAASVALLAVAAGSAWRLGAASARREALADELVAGHVRSLLPGHLMDVASTDQHTVKPWFAGRIDFSPPVHDLAARGYPLAGGRVDYVDGRPAAVLVYARRRHWINVFLWPRDGSAPNAASDVTLRGYHVLDCGGPALSCRAVSDVSEPDLRQFVSLLRASDAALGGRE